MTIDRPSFVPNDAKWQPRLIRFNSYAVQLFETEADPHQIKGWSDNPRIRLILRRWRNASHRSFDAVPNDEEMLDLMLDDDDRNRGETFAIKVLGEDVKRNGIREPLIVTWEGDLIDGNRRKFAVMWAVSGRGGASESSLNLLRRIPILVLPQDASQIDKQQILIQENYAESLKKRWPEVVTNGELYERYRELDEQFPHENDLAIRRRLREEFPRFGITEIRNRIDTWQLIEQFRGDFSDEIDDDDLEQLINNRFQYFRQANDTFRKKNVFTDPEFIDLIFTGIRHELFPSFASVRAMDDIHQSVAATEIFLQGEGLSDTQKRANFQKARDEAGRERAEREMLPSKRLDGVIEFLENMTSKQLGDISNAQRARLTRALERVIAQSEVSSAEPQASDASV